MTLLSQELFRAVHEDADVTPQTKEGKKMVFGKWVDTGKEYVAKAGEKASAVSRKGREKIKGSGAFGKGFAKRAGWDDKGHHDEKPKEAPKEDEKGVSGFFRKHGRGVAKAFSKLGEKAKKIWSDPEYRKKVFSKDTLLEKKGESLGKAWAHMKHEGHNVKVASKALYKIRNTEVKDIGKTWKAMPDSDKKAIKGAAVAIGLTVGGTLAGGHFGAAHLAQHFAMESLGLGTIRTAAAAVLAHRFLVPFALLTEEEQEAAGKELMSKLYDDTVARLDKFSRATPEEAAALFAKLQGQSSMSEEELFESYFQ